MHLANLTDADFDQVRSLIYGRAGIKLGDSKRAMVVSRLTRRLRALHLNNFPDYLQQLKDPEAEEWQNFTNALTTNLTSFFREPHHFDILASKLRESKGQATFKIWCAAASTGEEPYSIAMVCREVGNQGPRKVEIIASDVDTNVLKRCVAGVYPMDSAEKLGKERLKRFFYKGTGPNEGLIRVRPELQQNLDFIQVNLLHKDWPVPNDLDVIFCRNVMIYFDKPTQRTLIEHCTRLMKPDALFISGHSESLYHCDDYIRSIGRTVYRRADV